MHRLALQERPVAAAHLLASSLGSWPPRPTRRKPVRGEPAAPHIAAPPWAAGRQDALDEHRGTSRATSDSLCQLYGAAALPDHPGRPPRESRGWSSACVDARLVIRLRLWLGKQDALDKHLVHRCELLALHYACRRAPRPSQPPPELRSALSGMMPRPRDAQLCPAPPLPTALHHPGSFLSALTERSPPATRHSAAVVVVVINSTL